jgi:hypothetical protein
MKTQNFLFMKLLKLFAAILPISMMLVTGCKKDFSSNSRVATDELKKSSLGNTTQSSAALKKKLSQLRTSLPAGYEKRMTLSSAYLLKAHPEYRSMVRSALAVEPSPCDDNTLLNQWLNEQLADWDDDVIFFAVITGMLDFPTYDALFFENSSNNQYFGVNGEYTHTITKTFRDLKRFWNIEFDDIVLAAMHGKMLLNRDKVIRIDRVLFGDSQADAEFWADLIIDLLNEVPQFRHGDHPIFTFNSFAVSSFNFPPYGVVPDKIIMGDGVLDGLEGIGFGDVGPQAVLAHEFAHQVQFQLGLSGNVNSPEGNRRDELMADAFAAYYLSHARGASMQWKRVKQFLQVFFNIGDCSFTSGGHHGTPTQRMAAAEWGYSVANNAQKQGHILTAQQFFALFEAELPDILAH